MSTLAAALRASGRHAEVELLHPPTARLTVKPLALKRRLRRLQRLLDHCQTLVLSAGSETTLAIRVLTMAVWGRFLGKRVVICYRLPDTLADLAWARPIALPVLRQIAQVAVLSEEYARDFRDHDLPVTVLPPLAPETIAVRNRRRDIRPAILCTRSLTRDNNVACLLRAFAFVKQKFPRAELVLSGDGPLRTDLEHLADELRLTGLSFETPADAAAEAALMHSADLYVNPSSIDELPDVLFTAMAAGLPVVTTDAGLIPEFVRDGVNGLTAPVNSHVRLAEQIIALVETPNLGDDIAARARHLVVEHQWKNVAPSYDALMDGSSPDDPVPPS